MQSHYTVYFNDGVNVTPLFYIESYTAADERFTETAKVFTKRFYPGADSLETPFVVKKYEEPVIFVASAYADYAFKKGIIFAKKMHEAVVYEKIHYPGKIRDSYEVKMVGRIGVLCQTQAMPEQDRSYIESLKLQIDQKDRIITQQETMIKRLEADVARLERSAAPESPKFFSNPLYDFSSPPAPIPPPPIPVPPPYQSKVLALARKGQVSGDVLQELEEIASLTPAERREKRERERQERQRRKRKEEKRREREREEKRLAQAAEDAATLDLLIKEISDFGTSGNGC